jgi:hypothetical protein
MSDAQSKVAATRAKLESTLDSIEDKFNVPQRASELTEQVKVSFEKNPVPWIVAAAAVAVGVVGLIAWALSSDD